MTQKQFFQCETPHLFAHRGGNLAGKQNENTVAAFQSAVDSGCTYLETDVVLTKDNKVVTYHGSRTKREAKKTRLLTRKQVQTTAYKDISSVLGVEVPLLEDVLKKFPQTRFSIDLKTDEVVLPTVELIHRTNSVDRVCLASFSLRRLLRASKLFKSSELVALAYCIHPRLRSLIGAFPGAFLGTLAAKGVDCVHIHHKSVNKRIVKVAHSQGIVVYVWTVNTETDFKKCIDMGVGGIISDETRLLSIRKM